MREMWNKSWNTNVTGTNVLTYTLMPLLLKSINPRLLFITSGTSSLTESTSSTLPIDKSPPAGWPKSLGMPAYRASKSGLNMMMRQWTRVLKEDGVKVFCVSPGFLATGLGMGKEMNAKFGAGDPSVGADFVRDVVEGKEDENVGLVVRRGGPQPW
jgi:NAD(P)-dependent dehydrogenase (short-subunit alcohol dehydrogenase family)